MESIVFGFLSRARHARTRFLAVGTTALLAGCAASSVQPPYPAFIQADELADIFLAGLPGIRAKRFAGNPDTRRSSNRLSLPAEWSFSTGGLPNKSVEIYVLAGQLKLGEFTLQAGSYAYLPDGSSGVPMETDGGAQILYFLDDANPDAVIRTPLISSRDLIPWNPISGDPNDVGLSIKELRADPGSGARTFLLRIDRGATRAWQSLSVLEEGYLLEGEYRHAECVEGKVSSGTYTRGGYYHRPAESINGGPESTALTPAVWYVRLLSSGESTTYPACGTG